MDDAAAQRFVGGKGASAVQLRFRQSALQGLGSARSYGRGVPEGNFVRDVDLRLHRHYYKLPKPKRDGPG
jgi:hypothetical protein